MKAQDVYRRAADVSLWVAVLSLTLSSATFATASSNFFQSQDTTKQKPPTRLTPVTVTATRSARDVFTTPQPVGVVGQAAVRERAPNNAADLFRTMAGLDVSGVGINQVRPIIRGQRGQRVLLLADGLRLNNSRRQQDFGEIPALIDVSKLDRLEVVRGPASVLYGSDAIGGVVNLITRTPDDEGLHGFGGYRYSTHDGQSKAIGGLSGRFGQFSFLASGSYRNGDQYNAPSGSYGNITLASAETVFDTGVEDGSVDAYAAYDIAANHRVFGKVEFYRADTTGFGYVDPAAYAPDLPSIEIRYPLQRFSKYSLGYHAARLGTAVADRLDVTGYYQRNERELSLDVFIPFGPQGAQPAGLQSNSLNTTDLKTFGGRVEAAKLAGSRVMFTYGIDFFRDDSENSDSAVTTIMGFGPPTPDVDLSPSVPNAILRSFGAFAQADIELTRRASIILGARYQDVHAETQATTGFTEELVSENDRTLVGAANAIYQLTNSISLVGTVGRGFRAPNLVERFFNGATPEGAGFQVPNPNLEPETSINVDFGARYRDRQFYLEGFVFRNEVREGIRIAATGDTIQGLEVFQNVNVDKLRYVGVELSGDWQLPFGVTVGAGFTYIDSKDVLDPSNPVGDSFDQKFSGRVRYTHSSNRLWVEYDVRHNGERKDVDLGTNPIGETLPAFTVHNARAGVILFQRGAHVHRVGISVVNLTNALYAEFSNISFFRPEPERRLVLTWDVSF